MTTEYENYDGTENSDLIMYQVYWHAQTFTVGATAHTITSVKLKLWKDGNPGTFTVSIRAVDGSGHPTGSDLTSGTIDGNTFTTDGNGAWYEITFTEYTFLANTKYAIVCRALNGSYSPHNDVVWRGVNPGGYADGNSEQSNDSGGTWSDTGRDNAFEVWGNLPVEYINVSESGAGVDAILEVLDGEFINISDGGAGTDSILGVEEWLVITDTGLGTDAILFQGSVLIDGADLPHVQRIHITEPTILSSKPVSGELPTRIWLGKQGRTVEFEGWTDSLTTLESLKAYADGTAHDVWLPDGTNLSVHIIDVSPQIPVWPDEYPYTIHAEERMD